MNTIKRQLDIPAETYQDAEEQQLEEKRETGKKRPLYEILTEYVVRGGDVIKQERKGISVKIMEDDRETEDANTWNEVAKSDSLLTISKKRIPEYKEKIVHAVTEGYADPVEVIARIAAFEKIFIGDSKNPGVKKMLTDQVINEIENSGGVVNIGNIEISSMESGVKYDYSHDPIWNEINDDLSIIKEKIKNREIFLKGVKSPNILDGEEPQTELYGDEIIELKPPLKTSTTTFKVSIK